MRKIKYLVIHCSDSSFGTARMIDRWHKEREFKMIGYHFVILNGYPTPHQFKNKQRWTSLDGSAECGRDLDADPYIDANEVGAHAYGFNRDSVGICLIGQAGQYTPRQLYSLRVLVNEMLRCFNLPTSAVVGHCELNPHKTCPNINMDNLRGYLEDYNKIGLLLNHYWRELIT